MNLKITKQYAKMSWNCAKMWNVFLYWYPFMICRFISQEWTILKWIFGIWWRSAWFIPKVQGSLSIELVSYTFLSRVLPSSISCGHQLLLIALLQKQSSLQKWRYCGSFFRMIAYNKTWEVPQSWLKNSILSYSPDM